MCTSDVYGDVYKWWWCVQVMSMVMCASDVYADVYKWCLWWCVQVMSMVMCTSDGDVLFRWCPSSRLPCPCRLTGGGWAEAGSTLCQSTLSFRLSSGSASTSSASSRPFWPTTLLYVPLSLSSAALHHNRNIYFISCKHSILYITIQNAAYSMSSHPNITQSCSYTVLLAV